MSTAHAAEVSRSGTVKLWAMVRWGTIAAALLVACLLKVGGASGPDADPARAQFATRPNIILILADDMGYSDLGCYGSPIPTPNIDRLAQGGLRFTQFYNGARCCPTRAALLTGLYAHQAGIGDMVGPTRNYPGDLSRNAITLGEGLSAAGYSTYMSGKWHVTPWRPNSPSMVENTPTDRGFEHFYGIIQSVRSYYNPPSLMEDGKKLPATTGDYYLTDALTDHAVKYLHEQKKDKPYFLYMAYTAPHFPIQAPEADIAKYRGKFKAGWDVLKKQRYENQLALKLIDPAWPLPNRDPQELPWNDIDPAYIDWFDTRMAVYTAMIQRLDQGVGAIIKEVKARGDADNTLIIFLSDNGGCAEEVTPEGLGDGFPTATRAGKPIHLGNDPAFMPGPEDTYESYGLEWAGLSNTPFRKYKSFVHEGGISTPLIAYWPGRIKPGITREIGHVIDFMPTLLEVAQATYPKEYKGHAITPVEGRSLLPVLAGQSRPEVVYGWEHEGNRAVRVGDWKMVSMSRHPWELYDLNKDRLETHDLAQSMPEKLAEMESKYNEWATHVGAKPFNGRPTLSGWEDPASHYKKK
jgi:arylsulfatase A-like enzyme